MSQGFFTSSTRDRSTDFRIPGRLLLLLAHIPCLTANGVFLTLSTKSTRVRKIVTSANALWVQQYCSQVWSRAIFQSAFFPPVSHLAVPMFLSTKLMPRGDDDIIEKREDTENADGSRSHVEAVERFNESVDDISASYQAAADDAIAKLVSSSGSSR